MKIRYLFLVQLTLLLVCPISIKAQLIEWTEVKKQLAPSDGLQVGYTFTIGDFVSKGHYFADKGGKFVLDSPDIKAWYNGESLWLYSILSEEVQLTRPTKEELAELNPLVTLETIRDDAFTIVRLPGGLRATPKQADQWRIEWVEVFLDPSFRPLKVLLKERGSDWIQTIEIHKIKKERTSEMRDPLFYQFTKNKMGGVEVIDLR